MIGYMQAHVHIAYFDSTDDRTSGYYGQDSIYSLCDYCATFALGCSQLKYMKITRVYTRPLQCTSWKDNRKQQKQRQDRIKLHENSTGREDKMNIHCMSRWHRGGHMNASQVFEVHESLILIIAPCPRVGIK